MSNIISKSISTVKNWWVFVLIGAAFIASSFWVLNTPVESYMVLAVMFSVLIFASGISTTIFTLSNKKYLDGWGWMLAGGIFDIIFGLFMMKNNEYSLSILHMFVGFWILFRGINVISASLELKKLGLSQWIWLLLLGITVSLIGLFMVFDPTFGVINVVYLTFLGLLFMGISHIIFGLNLRKIKKSVTNTIDNVKDRLKEGMDSLKEDIISNVDDITPEEKKDVEQKFDNLKSLLD